jgi:DNA-binding SARP family transcriptional activator
LATSQPPARASDEAGLRLQVLGSVRLWRGGVELDPGPRQQAYLLALLLARARTPIARAELIDLIWDHDVPSTAVNVLQKYISALRRLLEPDLPARGSSRYLQRRGSGYQFVPDPGTLDVVVFRDLVTAAEAQPGEHQREAALELYLQALALWHGPAGDGLARGTASASVFSALDSEFFAAALTAADLATEAGRPEPVLPALHLAARMAPLHEPLQARLVTTLAAAGQQAEALSVFTAVRARLAEDLGVDPGPALRAAHQQVLRQTLALTAAAPEASPLASVAREAAGEVVVGRMQELAVLRHALTSALGGADERIIVEGEPGVGKTFLMEDISRYADRHGALIVWGRCLEGDGTPSMWPWIQAITTIVDALPLVDREKWQSGDLGRLLEARDDTLPTPVLPDSGAQFRLFEQAVAVLAQISARRPALLVIDDLQWADTASLHLFAHLAARLPNHVLIIGALRDRAPHLGPELARLLATISRQPRHRRIRLGPLDPSEVAELVRRETGRSPRPATADIIYTRSAGNPFFARELSRLINDNDGLSAETAARDAIPSTVRDVVRDRMSGLDDHTADLLQIAALIGRDVDLTLLARVAGLDIQTCFDRLEPVEALGLLSPTPTDPYSFHFVHDIVRESVIATTRAPRTLRLHLRIADALEGAGRGGGSLAERLAHHLWEAGPLADPARTVRALISAGHRATTKVALEAAGQHLQVAARLARRADLSELELSALTQLTAVVGMRSGYVGSALDLLERAEQLARGLGRERAAADLLFSRWAAYSQGIQLEHAAVLAQQLLEQGQASSDPLVRAYGLHAWGIHQWDVGNIGEAYRYLSRTSSTVLADLIQGEEDPLRRDLRLLWPVMLAMMTALHGDLDTARDLLDTLEKAAGEDSYVVTVWAAFSVTIAALAGDAAWALRVAQRGIVVDPDSSFAFLGSYPRLARCWARAVSGEDPVGAAAEAEQIIIAALLDPPRSGLITWYALLGEMHLAAGKPAEAAAALDRAELLMGTHGQRYPEGFLLLLRARVMHARGEPVTAVTAAARRAWTLATEREAHLFTHRAEDLMAALGPGDR